MSKFLAIMAAVVAVCATLGQALATEPSDSSAALQAFRDKTSPVVLDFVRLTVEAAVIKSNLGVSGALSDVDRAIADARSAAAKEFPAALREIAHKPAAATLLKEYYAVWLAALEGLKPQVTETKFAYGSRQGEALRRANEAWFRFEIESGFTAARPEPEVATPTAAPVVDPDVAAEEARGFSMTDTERERWDEVRASVEDARKRCFVETAMSSAQCDAAVRLCGKRHIADVEPVDACLARIVR